MQEKTVQSYRLSPQQKRLWLLQQKHPGPYRAQCSWLLEGPLDRAKLQTAMDVVIERHEILHTTFQILPNTVLPVQVISHGTSLSWREYDLTGLSQTVQQQKLDKIFREGHALPLDFTHDSLLDCTIIRLGPMQHVFNINLPALCADQRSLRNLLSEFSLAYAAASEFSGEPMQYADYAAWRHELLNSEETKAGREYWRQLDLPALNTQRLPLEQRSTHTEFAPRSSGFTIAPERVAQIEARAREHDCDVSTFLLACYQVLLGRLSGQTRIVVGFLFDGRKYEELQSAIGLFASYLPVSSQLDRDKPFGTVLAGLKETIQAASLWQEYFSWEQISAADGEVSSFPFAFEYIEGGAVSSVAGSLSVSRLKESALFDPAKINLSIQRSGDELLATFHYDASLFSEHDINRIGERFDTLVTSVCENTELPLGELSIIPLSEERRLLQDFNNTWVGEFSQQCVHELVAAQAQLTPDAPAVVSETENLTYRELNERANQLSHYLQELGVGPDHLVGICVERSATMVVGLLGILGAGGAYVPLDPEYPEERLAFMIEDAQLSVIVTTQDLLDRLPAVQGHIVCLERDAELIRTRSKECAASNVTSQNLAYVIYTSGSTGRPKGVMISHRSINNRLLWMQHAFPLEPSDRVLQKTVYSFDASVWEIFLPLMTGAQVVMAQPGGHKDSAYLVATVADQEITVLQLVPSMLQVLIEEPGLSRWRSLKRLFCGGEALPIELQQRFFQLIDAELINLYGPTEVSIDATSWICERNSNHAGIVIGRPIANTQVYVLDERLRLAPIGVAGELFVSGVGLARGYHLRPDLTVERFLPNPFSAQAGQRLYRTGDLARYHEDGAIEYLGRADHQVKLRGFRVELGEIEAVLLEHKAVREAVVTIGPDATGNQRLVAYFVPRNGNGLLQLDEQQLHRLPNELGESGNGYHPQQVLSAIDLSTDSLRTHVAARVPSYLVPSAFVQLYRMPRLPNGKVDRSKLPAPEISSEGKTAYVAPSTPIEEVMARIWEDVLGLTQISVAANFFELGGHSLLATQVMSRLREALSCEMPLRRLFELPTIAELAAAVEQEKKIGSSQALLSPIETVDRAGELSLSFSQERLWFLQQMEPASSAYNLFTGIRMHGRLDVASLEWTLQEIVRRHEILRMTFETVDGRPRQRINPAFTFSLPVTDLSAWEDGERAAEVERVATDTARTPFDLVRGPLLRAKLLKLGDEEHVLLLTMHHIISDGWSNTVLVREVTALYEAFGKGLPSPLPELPVQYADYAMWQRDWLQGEVLAEHLQYWREHLLGAPEVLELPVDKARPAEPSYRGARWNFEVGRELAAQIQEVCRRESVTTFMVLLAAFHVLLARYSGQEDMLIGIPVANRTRVELEALLGFFVNTLPVRLRLPRGETVRKLWARVKGATLGAYAHQDLPFERLVEELQPERSLSRQALVQVLFIFQNVPRVRELNLPGLKLEEAAVHNDPAVRTDLDLYVNETGDRLSGVFVYSRELFEEATIGLMAQRLTRILEEMVSEPDKAVAELLAPAETRVELLPVAGGEEAPLTYHQERLWFIDEFERGNVYPASPTYHNIPLILHLRGFVDSNELQSSLATIISRHSVTQTRFVVADGQLTQKLAPHEPFTLNVIDLHQRATLDDALALALENSAEPFHLDQDLLVRATLFRIKHDEAVLALTIHHIIADKESLRILLSELQEVYAAEAENRAPQLPVLTAQFGDYARAQRALTEADFASLLFYWKWQLRGRLRALELPESRPRPAVHTYTAQWESFSLAEPLAARLKQRCEDSGTDMFTVTLAAFKVLLHRYARQDEIVVGSVARQRRQAVFAPLIGPFANLLVLRSDLGGNPSFAALCEQLRKTVAEARHSQDLPFDKLVQVLNPEKDMSRTALFDVLFEYDEQSWAPFSLGTASGEVVETNLGYGKYDLHVSLQQSGAAVQGTMVYNGDIYDGFLIREMMRHFQVLLQKVADAPHERIDDVVLLDREEEHQQLLDWNQTHAAWPVEQTIADLFERQVRATPYKTAVVLGDERLSYRELEERANRLAHHLRSLGVQAEQLVAVCLERSMDMIVALLGVLKAGGAYLALDPEYPPEHLRFVMDDSAAAHLITVAKFVAAVGVEDVATVLLDRDRELLSRQPIDAPSGGAGPHSLAYCIYTSGSTGRPKGVLVEHRNVVRLIINDKLPVVLQADEVWTMFHSYCFDFSVWEMYGALLHGGTLVIVPKEVTKDAALFLELLVKERVTMLNQTPTAFYRLAAESLTREVSDLALRYVIFGGEALRPALLKEWKRAHDSTKLVNMYGITETTVHVTYKEIDEAEIAADASNIGRPIPTTTTYIMDEKQRLLPVGVPGEIVVGGGGVSRGYLNREQLMSEKFVPNPYRPAELLYRSGDVGKLLPDGEMVYLGRSDDQVQIRGFRVEPGEVQSRLLAHAQVRKAEVVPRTGNEGVMELVAYVVVTNEGITVSELRSHLAAALPPYMVPSAFVFLAELPVTANGKVDRKALPAPSEERPELDAAFVEATTPIEETLAHIWSTVLRLERVGVSDDFFELGGHSLLAAQVIARVRDELGVEVPLRLLFEQPTVRGLAEAVTAALGGGHKVIMPPLTRTSREAPLPLSYAQQRLWFLEQLQPGNPVYHLPTAIRVTGPLNAAALEKTFAEIVRRHEILRTTFKTVEGSPRQVITPAAAVPVPLIDLRTFAIHERETESRRLISEEVLRPFDLSSGPLLRTLILRLQDDEHIFVVTMHHIISDGWSSTVLVREIGALYEAFATGSSAMLEELPLQYADYTLWQRDWLQGEVLESQLGYWRKQLSNLQMLKLPLDHPRPLIQSFRGAKHTAEIPLPVSEALKELGRSEDATLFMVLLAAFSVLLSRYSGQNDITIGTPVANRRRTELESLIGLFVNTLVLRLDTTNCGSFRSLVRQAREVCLGAYAHQDVPFEKLVDELQPERSLSHTPLFQVMLVLQNLPQEPVSLEGLRLQGLATDAGAAKFDLTLVITETGRGLGCTLEYNTDLFEADTTARLLSQFQTLLEATTRNADRPLATPPLLNDAERQELLAELSGTGVEGVDCRRTESLHELFEDQVARTPQAVAVNYDLERLTYAELNIRANRLAHYLQEQGVGPEVPVALCLERSIEVVVAILGVLKAGGAYLPLDPTYPRERLAFMIDDAQASVLLTQKHLSPLVSDLVPTTLVLNVDEDLLATQSEENPHGNATAANTAYIIYTSGSTGKSKGVLITHSNVTRLFASAARWFDFDANDVWTLFHSYAFDFSVWELWGALLYGGRLVVVPYQVSRAPEMFYELLHREQVTVLNQTPSAFRQLIRVEEGQTELPELRLRLIVFGGEALDPASLVPWIERHGDDQPQLINMYGITETTVHVTYRRIMRNDAEHAAGSLIGEQLPDLQLYALDQLLEPLPIGIAGELYVGGHGLARGYLRRPELTAERFLPNPFSTTPGARLYKTGDLARYVGSGEFEYIGRSDQQVKVRGFRIELGEIESALSQHPVVRELVVEAPIDANGECRLVAYVTLKEPTNISNLRAFLKERLPEHMIPSAFVVLDRLPLTENGKLDRRALPGPGTARPSLDESYVAPRTVVEELLATIWADVLDLDRVGVEDNFFALGGDSIRSVRVLAQARERGLELSIQQLFRHQTIAELAREINVTEISDLSVTRTEPFDLISESDRSKLPSRVVDAYPVTTLQGGMLYHMALSPNTAVYHNVNSWHLRARFDIDHFKAAVARAVARHPIFRTSFDLTSYSEPMQLVHESATMQVDVTDLRHVSNEEQDEILDQFAAAERLKGFDLTHPPLLRFHLHRRTDESFQFTLTECHPILDGWSLNSTLSEIFTSYFSLMAGEVTPPEAPPAMTVRDFVSMERQALASEEHRAFWQETLRDLNVTRVPRLPAPYHNGDRQRIQQEYILLTQTVSAALHSAARTLKVPLKSLLLAAHFKVLSVLSGETDIVTGVVVNGRPEAQDGEQVRGLFLNTLPFRLHIPDGSWADLIRATFKAEWELLPHRRYPLLALQREMGGQPLFDAQFNFVHFHVLQGILRSGEVEVLLEPRRRVIEEAHFALTAAFSLDLFSEQIKLMLQYDTDELSQAQVQAIAGYYVEVFERIAKGTAERHDADVPLPDNERRQMLVSWNETARDYPLDQCLHELFEAQAARTPDAVAVVTDDESYIYSELNGWANQVARHLRDLGVGPDARVAILLERSIEMVVGLLGILKAGAAYVPLDPDYPSDRLHFMLDDCSATVLLTDSRLAPSLPACSARIVCLDASNEDISQQGTENLNLDVSPDELAYVIYTSGSTGRPKGVMISHRSTNNHLVWMQSVFPLQANDRILQKTVSGFDASVSELFLPLITGAQVYLARPGGHQDSHYLAATVAERDITVLQLVPSMLQVLIEEPQLAHWRSLKRLFCGGEVLPVELQQRFFQLVDAELINLYGPTEASIDATYWVCERESRPGGVVIGRPLANTQVYVLDERLRPVPIGVGGELFISGVGLARGYHNLPGLTAEKFIPNPFGEEGSRLYRTGDLVRYLPDGLLEFCGRADSQIKLRGMRIELSEIEAALREYAAVAGCVVMLRGEGMEATLVAYIVPVDEVGPGADELRAYLASRLPRHMVPSIFVTLEQLPLMVNGKVDRRALPEPSPDTRVAMAASFVAPANELERTIAGIWSEVLGREEIGTHDNFFDLGGHSMRLLLVHLKLREAIGLDMPMSELFQYPTVSTLAAHLQAGGDGESLDSSEERGARRKQSVSRRRMQRDAARAAANQ